MEEGASDTPLLMDQLEVGKEYEVIVTNLSGFYRYRLGDVVKVTGHHNECPMLVFSYRKSQLVSMYGEKVTETALRTAVEGMAAEYGMPVLEYSVYADAGTDPGHYVMLLESDREVPPEEWPRLSEILNRKLCEVHESYNKKIQQKIMLPLEVKFVEPQTYALYRDLKIMGGGPGFRPDMSAFYPVYITNGMPVAIISPTSSIYDDLGYDLGKSLTVKATAKTFFTGTVTSDAVAVNLNGTVAAKAAKPALSSITTDTIVVATKSGCEYSLDGKTWQANGTFSGLTAGAAYTVYARVAATSAAKAGEMSDALIVVTDVLGMIKGDINTNGTLDTSDAVLVLEQALEFIDLHDAVKGDCDFNGDGKINTSDARAVLRYIVAQ